MDGYIQPYELERCDVAQMEAEAAYEELAFRASQFEHIALNGGCNAPGCHLCDDWVRYEQQLYDDESKAAS